MSFDVRFSDAAADVLVRLHEHLLARADTIEDLQLADYSVDEIEIAFKAQLSSPTMTVWGAPISSRQAGSWRPGVPAGRSDALHGGSSPGRTTDQPMCL
ncbi:MAG: hypothetical protein KGN16_24670 [Burkholderiales bacterium]|nr:hypothetical protein [Burkholderiales bacterium]